MNILVTGATGFIGSHICRELLAQGFHVRALHRANSPQIALKDIHVEHILGDITQIETLLPAMRNIDIVFHTAAQLGRRDPNMLYTVTVEGTRNVLKAAMQSGVQRVIHTITVAALGIPLETNRRSRISPFPINEQHCWNIPSRLWRYGHAKHLAEKEVQQAVARALDVVIVNPALVIGALDLNFIGGNILIHIARGHVPFAIQGGLNIIHITDVTRGHLAAMQMGKTGERYILGNENLSHYEFLNTAAKLSGTRPIRWIIPGVLLRSLASPASRITRSLNIPVNGEALYKAGYRI